MVKRLRRVGDNVKLYMLTNDFNIMLYGYTRQPFEHFSLFKDILCILMHGFDKLLRQNLYKLCLKHNQPIIFFRRMRLPMNETSDV